MVMIQAISRSGACCDWLVLPCDWPVLDGSGNLVIGYSFICKNNLNRQQFFSLSLYWVPFFFVSNSHFLLLVFNKKFRCKKRGGDVKKTNIFYAFPFVPSAKTNDNLLFGILNPLRRLDHHPHSKRGNKCPQTSSNPCDYIVCKSINS